jgi:hypothetical protein
LGHVTSHEFLTQTDEYGLRDCRIDASERRLRFMLPASVKSVFSEAFDVG